MTDKIKAVRHIENWHEPMKLVPNNVPAGWELWNAPRPLYGHMQMVGPFLHGLLYAAIDPHQPDADMWRERNIQLDGRLVVFISRAKIEAWGRKFCAENEMDYDDFSYDEVVRSWQVNHKDQ